MWRVAGAGTNYLFIIGQFSEILKYGSTRLSLLFIAYFPVCGVIVPHGAEQTGKRA